MDTSFIRTSSPRVFSPRSPGLSPTPSSPFFPAPPLDGAALAASPSQLNDEELKLYIELIGHKFKPVTRLEDYLSRLIANNRFIVLANLYLKLQRLNNQAALHLVNAILQQSALDLFWQKTVAGECGLRIFADYPDFLRIRLATVHSCHYLISWSLYNEGFQSRHIADHLGMATIHLKNRGFVDATKHLNMALDHFNSLQITNSHHKTILLIAKTWSCILAGKFSRAQRTLDKIKILDPKAPAAPGEKPPKPAGLESSVRVSREEVLSDSSETPMAPDSVISPGTPAKAQRILQGILYLKQGTAQLTHDELDEAFTNFEKTFAMFDNLPSVLNAQSYLMRSIACFAKILHKLVKCYAINSAITYDETDMEMLDQLTDSRLNLLPILLLKSYLYRQSGQPSQAQTAMHQAYYYAQHTHQVSAYDQLAAMTDHKQVINAAMDLLLQPFNQSIAGIKTLRQHYANHRVNMVFASVKLQNFHAVLHQHKLTLASIKKAAEKKQPLAAAYREALMARYAGFCETYQASGYALLATLHQAWAAYASDVVQKRYELELAIKALEKAQVIEKTEAGQALIARIHLEQGIKECFACPQPISNQIKYLKEDLAKLPNRGAKTTPIAMPTHTATTLFTPAVSDSRPDVKDQAQGLPSTAYRLRGGAT